MGAFYKGKIERASSMLLRGRGTPTVEPVSAYREELSNIRRLRGLEPPNWRTTFLKRRIALSE